MKEFDIKARERILKQKEENKKKLLKQQENLLKRNNISIKENLLLNNYAKKKAKRVETPEKLKNEIKKININIDFEKKKK